MKRLMMGVVTSMWLLAESTTFAAGTGSLDVNTPGSLGSGLLLGSIYAIVGTLLLIICFKAFDKILTKVDLEGEVLKGNIAAGILSAAILISIALIIASAISG